MGKNEKKTNKCITIIIEQTTAEGTKLPLPLFLTLIQVKYVSLQDRGTALQCCCLSQSYLSLCVIDADNVVSEEYTTYFRSAIAFGRVKIIEDDCMKRSTIQKLAEKYSSAHKEGIPEEINRGFNNLTMIEFDIEHMTGKESIELVRNKK